MRANGVTYLQAAACFLIAAAGLVPVVHDNRPFWGLLCISFDDRAPTVSEVEINSPAELAGIRANDVILSVNGSAASFSTLMAVLDGLRPGETARLRVKRGESELDVTVAGQEPPIAMIYYPTVWHPIAGGVGLALGLLVVATGLLRPAPRWRPAVLICLSLALAAVFFWAIVQDNVFAHWQMRRYHNLNWGAKWHFGQSWVGLVASIALALLATWELRGLLGRSVAARDEPPKEPQQPTGTA
jgi:membrane-associated protease RseP (regulator of RpoE activity)